MAANVLDRFEFRSVRVNEAEEVAEIEKICFPPHEVCSKKDMFERDKARRDSMVYDAKTYDELKTLATTKDGGFIKINWCGNVECENKIKDEFGIKSRCLIENEKITGPCTVCGKEAKTRLYIGRQY